MTASPALPVRSTAPNEFSSRCRPAPSRNVRCPFELTTSDAAFRPATDTSPNRLRSESGAFSGMAIR